MSTTHIEIAPELKHSGRQFGYGVAVVINLVMLFIVQNILAWGWMPFLTEEFTDVIPWINMSLVVTIVVNLIYQFDDSPPVKSTGQILVNLIGIYASYAMFRIFPFDFSAYDFEWAILVRVVLILAMVGSGIGVLTESLRLIAREPAREGR